MKPYVLSKASLAYFPLTERKLDLKSKELSRMSRAEPEVSDRLGRSEWNCYGESRTLEPEYGAEPSASV